MEKGIFFIENRTLVVFGGTIGVADGTLKDGNMVLLLQETGIHNEIGEKIPHLYDENKKHVMLIFDNTKSVDVVINHLKEIKKKLCFTKQPQK